MGGEQNRNEEIARRWLTDGARGADIANEIFAPSFTSNGHVVGADGPKRNVANRLTGFPDFDVTIDDQLAVDDRVATRLHWSGTHLGDYSGLPATGRRVEVMALTIFRFENARVVENWTVIDQFALFHQLGALPRGLLGAQVPAASVSGHPS